MIHVVSGANQHLYGRELEQMFRMRHDYYIKGHGWAGLKSQGDREIDEFDDGDVIYLLCLDPWGEVAASVRLNPTLGPTLLDKFADHSDEPLPKHAACWDISRWIAQPKHRRAENPRWPSNHQRELIVGILEFCQTRGLTHLTMLSELRLAERMGVYGWPVRFLGAPREYEGGKGIAVAAEIEVGPHVLALTRHKTGVHKSMLIEIGSASLAAPPATRRVADDLHEIVAAIGPATLNRLTRAVALSLSDDGRTLTPREIELAHAFEELIASACESALAKGGASTGTMPDSSPPLAAIHHPRPS